MKKKMSKDLVKSFMAGFKSVIKDEGKEALAAWSVGSALLTISKAVRK